MSTVSYLADDTFLDAVQMFAETHAPLPMRCGKCNNEPPPNSTLYCRHFWIELFEANCEALFADIIDPVSLSPEPIHPPREHRLE